jgi:type II restriction enzyme
MPLPLEKSERIAEVLKQSLREKFANYQPETDQMPFHTRLLGLDRMALFSFIHSLNTNFGTTIFEPVAVELAKGRFRKAQAQVSVGNSISVRAQAEIQKIIDDLTTATSSPDKVTELSRILPFIQIGEIAKVKPTKVDLLLENTAGEIFLFDLKTAKPNKGNFREFKRTLLEWAAIAMTAAPTAIISTAIAIPYNPYHPKPYSRWTMKGMLDLPHELKVADEFWDFVGGQGTFAALLDIFEKVGIELRPEIDVAFSKFNKA